jgi:hypothetical protein
MQEEKHSDALREVMKTIDDALKSSNILEHKRRLTSMLSIGVQHIVELYLHRLNVIKPGAQVKHEWFRLGDNNIIIKFNGITTKPYDNIRHLSEMTALANKIEINRNEMLYGSPRVTKDMLLEKIDYFLEIKKIVEETGDVV